MRREAPKEIVGLTVENAMARLMSAAMTLWSLDTHDFSTRPCSTCNAITVIVGEEWGCSKLALEARKARQ